MSNKTRRNLHLDDDQYARMHKLALAFDTNTSELYRQGGDLIIAKKIEELKARKAAKGGK